MFRQYFWILLQTMRATMRDRRNIPHLRRHFGSLGVVSSRISCPASPKGILLRRVNSSGDISWHKTRIFMSEVFRFEEFAFELVTPGFYRVFFRDMDHR